MINLKGFLSDYPNKPHFCTHICAQKNREIKQTALWQQIIPDPNSIITKESQRQRKKNKFFKSYSPRKDNFLSFLHLLQHCLVTAKSNNNNSNLGHAPPVPGLPETDPQEITTTTKSSGPKVPQLLTSYVPAVMQGLAYFTDMLGYTLNEMTTLEPPLGSSDSGTPTTPVTTTWTTRPTTTTTRKPTTAWRPPPSSSSVTWWSPPSTTTPATTTTTRRTTTTTTTRRPTTTTKRPESTTPVHKPGYYSPEKPPSQKPSYNQHHRPTQASNGNNNNNNGNKRPNRPTTSAVENKPTVDINNQFFNWFFQSKPKHLQLDSGKSIYLFIYFFVTSKKEAKNS